MWNCKLKSPPINHRLWAAAVYVCSMHTRDANIQRLSIDSACNNSTTGRCCRAVCQLATDYELHKAKDDSANYPHRSSSSNEISISSQFRVSVAGPYLLRDKHIDRGRKGNVSDPCHYQRLNTRFRLIQCALDQGLKRASENHRYSTRGPSFFHSNSIASKRIASLVLHHRRYWWKKYPVERANTRTLLIPLVISWTIVRYNLPINNISERATIEDEWQINFSKILSALEGWHIYGRFVDTRFRRRFISQSMVFFQFYKSGICWS